MHIYETLTYCKTGQVVVITLYRPAEANGLNSALASELAIAAQACAEDPSVKAVILTGQGKFFCAGGDVKEMATYGDHAAAGLKHLADNLHKALATLARMPAPVIMAVNGTAAGAGFSLAISGDLVLASESASLTLAYTRVGLSPDGGSSYYLPRLVGMRRAQELMFTNRVLSADEALEWGLINRVVPDDSLMESARELAEMFVTGAAGSNAAIKKLLMMTFNNGLETQLEIESEYIARCAGSEDGQEGICSFVEKRRPGFQ